MRAAAFSAALLVIGACRSSPTSEEPFPIGALETIRIEGSTAFTRDELAEVVREEIGGAADGPISKADVDDAAFALEVFHRERGFPFVLVDYDWEPESGRATFRVDEGNRVRVDSIRILGQRAFDEEAVQALFGGLPELDGAQLFVEDTLRAAVEDLRTLYLRSGHLDVEIALDLGELAPEVTSVDVEVTITEGTRYVLREIAFEPLVAEGGAEPPGEVPAVRRLHERVADAIGRPFTPRLAFGLRARLVEELGKRGRPEVVIEFRDEPGEGPGDVRLLFLVDPGPRVTIGPVEIRGLDRTREGFVRSRVFLREGDVYDSEKLRRSFSSLYRSGLFDSVRIQLEGGPTDTVRPLRVAVSETAAREVFLEPGFGTYEGPRLSVGASDRNLFGTGRGLLLGSTLSAKAQRGDLSFVDPGFLRSDVTATGTLFASRREQPSFTNTEYGVSLSLARRLASSLRASVSYRFGLNKLDDVDILDPEVQEILDDVDIASVAAGLGYDTRSDVFVPDQGTLATAAVEWAGRVLGSQVDFLKVTGSVAGFWGIWSGGVLAAGVKTGVIAPLGTTDEIPIQVRFFNGGDDTVRSFAEDELGPKDSTGAPIGGEAATTLSLELRQRLRGNLEGALFCDVGNVETDWRDYLDFRDLRTGLGVGLRYLLPIGHLRIDVARNPSPRDEEDDWVLHFAVGMAF